MWLSLTFILGLASSLVSAASGPPISPAPPSPQVDQYVLTETPFAKQRLMANIGPSGSAAPDTDAGLVIASPSSVNPDYFFYWVRDGSLVFKYLINEFVAGRSASISPTLETTIKQFASSQAILQEIDNLSGSVESTLNLGDPKFNVNETAFLEPWGRPQRDGPALRITALVTYANFLLSSSDGHQPQTSVVQNTIWPIIQKDANYVANEWNLSTFDLWEEQDGRSFFTTAIQHRALREAITLAQTLGSKASNTTSSTMELWTTQASNILCFLQSYWGASDGFITANANPGNGRSGIDANTILASIHTFDALAGCDSVTFQPCSDKALANLKVYVDTFRNASLYPINAPFVGKETLGVATGRYPEDIYFDGNPWYITTFSVTEQLNLALHTWRSQGSLTVTQTSLPFFRIFSPSITPNTFSASSPTFITLTSAISQYADSFLSLLASRTPADGALSEQFSKINGTQVSANDLSWSYAASLTAFNARAGLIEPGGWGAKGLKVPAGECQGNLGPTVVVMFEVAANTTAGETVHLTGSVDQLTNWSPTLALPMTPPPAGSNSNIWTVNVTLPAFTPLEYKYIRFETDGSVIWESDPNMALTTPGPGGVFVESDVWR